MDRVRPSLEELDQTWVDIDQSRAFVGQIGLVRPSSGRVRIRAWERADSTTSCICSELTPMAARVHPSVGLPMLAAYGLPRRVRAGGLAGPAHVPVRRLALGCPAAMHWLALLILCWRDPVRRLAPQVVARDFLDDLVAHATGPGAAELVSPIWDVTCAFGQAAGLRRTPRGACASRALRPGAACCVRARARRSGKPS